ncbi:MAG: class I SAM-dependent rRNA methyltransferase [Methylomonas sp.]
MSYPELFLKKNEDKRLRQGHLWVFSNEIDCQRSPLLQFSAGQDVVVNDRGGKFLGVGYINPNALICVRLLSRKPNTKIGANFFKSRLTAALQWRQRWFDKPYYRLVFGESDGLPGLVIDRFGSVLSVQITTAGMEQLKPVLLEELLNLLAPEAVVFKNDASQRQLENLSQDIEIAHGCLPEPLIIEENNARFYINVTGGQKTGWFYDHRLNREQFARHAAGLKVLDLFSYTGGWGVTAAMAGAAEVTCVDSSESALMLAEESAALNGVKERMRFVRSDVFEFLKRQREENQHYDAIVLDPPALIKRKKDFKAGYEAYRRLNHMALQVLASPGILVSASCSYHLSQDNLQEILRSASRHIDRHLVFVASGGQGADHPVLPAVPETGYLNERARAKICS